MGNVVRISSSTLAAIRAEIASAPDREICGLLFGETAIIRDHQPCRNVSPEPAVAFEIDPAALIAAYRAERQGGARLIGCYHSHPSGDSRPSRRDAADAVTEGWLWLIGSPSSVQAWRVESDGPVQDRFRSVDLAPIDSA